MMPFSDYTQFWIWFAANEKILYYIKEDGDLIDTIAAAIRSANSSVRFEIGNRNLNGKKAIIVISAGGIRKNIEIVEEFCKNVPKLKYWKVVKYKQRMPKLYPVYCYVEMGLTKYSLLEDDEIYDLDDVLNPIDIYYTMKKREEKIELKLYIKNYTKYDEKILGTIAFLFLDQALGEYDVMTKIGNIDFLPLTEKEEEACFPITELRKNFNKIIKR